MTPLISLFVLLISIPLAQLTDIVKTHQRCITTSIEHELATYYVESARLYLNHFPIQFVHTPHLIQHANPSYCSTEIYTLNTPLPVIVYGCKDAHANCMVIVKTASGAIAALKGKCEDTTITDIYQIF